MKTKEHKESNGCEKYYCWRYALYKINFWTILKKLLQKNNFRRFPLFEIFALICCDIITEFVFGVQLHHSVLVGTALASRTARTSRALEEQSAKKDAWKDVRNIIVIPKCVYLKRDRRRFHWKLLSFFFNLLIKLRSLFQIKVSTWPAQASLSLKKIWSVQRVRGINPHI